MSRMPVVLVLVLAAALTAGCTSAPRPLSAPPTSTSVPSPPGFATPEPTVAPPAASVAPPAPSATSSTPPDAVRGLEPVELQAEGLEGAALLSDLRLGHDPGTDRVVFEFEGEGVPAVLVEYVDAASLVDASGAVTPVAGGAVLQVALQPASGVDLSGAEFREVYTGPDRLDGPAAGTTAILEVARVEDFEAVLVWAVGVADEVPFRVLRLSDPARVVVELDAA